MKKGCWHSVKVLLIATGQTAQPVCHFASKLCSDNAFYHLTFGRLAQYSVSPLAHKLQQCWRKVA
ncbi:hypothetical protein A8L51_00055 [Pantoea stewartii]|nr:hypothetical protein [Pantoea stewartii]